MCRDKALSPALTTTQLPTVPHILSHPGLVFIKNFIKNSLWLYS